MDKDYEAVFEVTISNPKKEGKFNGEIVMTTSLAKVCVHVCLLTGRSFSFIHTQMLPDSG